MKELTKATEKIIELIRCPECQSKQNAEVLKTKVFWTRIHHCNCCNYIIFESEWEEVEK